MKLIRQNAKPACIFLTFLMLSITVPYQSVLAAMIGTEVTLDLTQAQQARDDINSLLLRETFRSGRFVQHDGHIVIIGDVNPGAEITAGGNVIVWGRLRGLVHAGAYGDETAVICALDLNPTQLRIAGQIAIPPQENGRKPTPEQAIIRDGQIVAESW